MPLPRAFVIVVATALAGCAARAPEPVALGAEVRMATDPVRSCEAALYRAAADDARALACADLLDAWQ